MRQSLVVTQYEKQRNKSFFVEVLQIIIIGHFIKSLFGHSECKPRHCKSFLMYKTLNFPSNLISFISYISRQKHITRENKSEKHAKSVFTIYIFFHWRMLMSAMLSHAEQTSTSYRKKVIILHI